MKRVLVLVLSTFAVQASAANFTTQRFAVNYVIGKDRTVEVTESIDVTFTIPQHGLVRKIPVRTEGTGGTMRSVSISLETVEADYGNGFRKEQATTHSD